ncbi:hypothetical protein P5G62_013395 [Neobacillus sp. 179-C4.2 HS]|jgi:hypothetical protein|uniref:Lipoprotein n=1 Tax=Neobacillus driksii TaxID=3035913 RepID=A0ABV4YTC6_9BACI|nr:hypothetical protein [Neobacillus sp. 179.-C4.2 HS]MDP5193774.1 hypothetical protein [Neobacillus sp. 179.-C4.2 HS]
MKKISWPILVGVTLLVGCQNAEPKEETKPSTLQMEEKAPTKTKMNKPFPYPNLLAESEQSFSLLVIGDQDTPIENNKEITEKVNDILSLPELVMAQTAYPELNIKTEPAYILFDQAAVVFQGKNLKELTIYLEQK